MATNLERPDPNMERADMRHEVAALHALIDAQMNAIRDNMEGVHRAIEAAPVAQKAAVETAMAAAEKAVNAALLAAKSAVDAAAFAHAREHELMAEALKQQQIVYERDKAQQNEWRATVNDISAKKIDEGVARALITSNTTRLNVIEQELATTRGILNQAQTTIAGAASAWSTGHETLVGRVTGIEQELASTRGGVAAQRAAVQGQIWVFGAVATVLSLVITIGGIALNHLWK